MGMLPGCRSSQCAPGEGQGVALHASPAAGGSAFRFAERGWVLFCCLPPPPPPSVTLSTDWAWTVALSGWLQSTSVVMKKVFSSCFVKRLI